MNDNKCQKKMMGRGAEGGCGTEEKPCTKISSTSTTPPPPQTSEEQTGFFEQAKKALTEKCPFDEEVNLSRVSTLPVALADFLSKYSNNNNSRKRHKKSSDSSKLHQQQQQVRAGSSNIWVETEDYFRPVGLNDIDFLFERYSFRSLTTTASSCLTIPLVKNSNSQEEENVVLLATVASSASAAALGSQHLLVKEEDKENEQQLMEIDGVPEANLDIVSPSKDVGASIELPPSSPERTNSGLEWLLGTKNKILLTSERPSKKRKHLGTEAGLDRLRVECPSQGHTSPVCHVCCLGDLAQHSNQLLVCDSCKVAVHQRCYGVQEFPDGLWLCSCCKYCSETGSELSPTPCLLCPKAGGALKPVANHTIERKSSVSARFVHLFCSQWMPEVYVEDTRKMEPIMNVGGIMESRKKLVCNVCKVKYGACMRCSHGTCRTSFHPICAREARHKMEIWGKSGSEIVELRAFCSKHSDFQVRNVQESCSHPSVRAGSAIENIPVNLLVNKPHKLSHDLKNGDKNTICIQALDTTSKSGNSGVSSGQDTMIPISNARQESECHDAQSSVSMESHHVVNQKKTIEGNINGNTNPSGTPDFIQVMKKLVDRGKTSLRDVALETSVSFDSLAATLAGDQSSFSPDMRCKIVKWLRNHAYIGSSLSGCNFTTSFGDRVAVRDVPTPSAAGAIQGSDDIKSVSVKSTHPRESMGNARIMMDNKGVCSSKVADLQLKDSTKKMDEVDAHSLVPNGDKKEFGNGHGPLYDDGLSGKDKDDREKVSSQFSGHENLASSSEQSGRPKVELVHGNLSKNGQANAVDDSVRVGLAHSKGERPISSVRVITPGVPNLCAESASCSYIHPSIQKRLTWFENDDLVKQESVNLDTNGLNGRDISKICSNNNESRSPCIDPNHTSSALKLKQLLEAKKMGVLDLSPDDEVEGELIYFQNKLMDNAVTRRRYCDNLIFRVIKALPQELDAERKQRWDSVLVNQYMCGIREAKKQGRKERRHKEAQAVLAAATAAAAASSRISSFRKDSQDETPHQEVSGAGGRTGSYSQLVPRAKETLSRLAVPRISAEKPSVISQLKSFMNEHQQLCDVCRRSETMLNPIFLCCNCKVAVHFGCYRGVKDHIGPWYCELCEELLPFRSPRSLPVHSREKSSAVAQCGLCGGTTGAFRKSTDGQWIHAFCAEWLLESTFRRGQPNLVEGMETILKGRDVCCICCLKIGLCIKCNYGNCQSRFHPTCARNAGFYMHVNTGGGKLHHKAYCDKHSLEQREKAEAQQQGPEELKAVKQIRVELERVRLLCERIIKREKVKRELLICSHNILASKRDSVAFSVLVRSPFFLPDVSSESATTSLRGHVDDNRSCSEAMQRSDEITVDSAVSGKHRVMLPAPMDSDQKTDGSSTSNHLGKWNSQDRPILSGKQLPHRPASAASLNLTDDEERRAKSRKYTETFQKELVMTSDQASVQNQRLPKGFAYVPIVCLPKEKPALSEGGSHESLEPDG